LGIIVDYSTTKVIIFLNTNRTIWTLRWVQSLL